MGEVRFMISEAAKKVNVETHALRYWEEELDLEIGRTEMGHRYYTEEDIQLFRCIKKLKNEGMLLKDLKPLIPKLIEKRKRLKMEREEHAAFGEEDTGKSEKELPAVDRQAEAVALEEQNTAGVQLDQVRSLIGQVLAEIVAANNEVLEKNISQQMNDGIFRKMDFFFQEREQREEEHFRKLDCLIRQQQANRKEAAREAAKGAGMTRLRRIFT